MYLEDGRNGGRPLKKTHKRSNEKMVELAEIKQGDRVMDIATHMAMSKPSYQK